MRGLNTRLEFAKAKLERSIFGGNEDGLNGAMELALLQAANDGASDGMDGLDMPAFFRDEEQLAESWEKGKLLAVSFMDDMNMQFQADQADNHELVEQSEGTRAQWDALSIEEQYEEWDRFHKANAQGVADDLYFYRVMMNMHLVGYVGD